MEVFDISGGVIYSSLLHEVDGTHMLTYIGEMVDYLKVRWENKVRVFARIVAKV